jgi:Protein of unknown function (DUF642)
MALSSQHFRTTTCARSRGDCRATTRFGGTAIVAASVVAVLAVGSVPTPAFAATTVSPTANLISNGCFRVPSLTSGDTSVGPGSSALPSWTIDANEVWPIASDLWQPSPGCISSLDLSYNASLSQTVKTTPGSLYVLKWAGASDARHADATTQIKVIWDGKTVASPTYDSQGFTLTNMGWNFKSIIVAATSVTSTVEFQQLNQTISGIIGSASLTAYTEPVNGFQATDANDPYSVAERQMLTKAPGTAVVPATGVPLFALRAVAADQVQHGAGLLIIWTIAPSAQFVHQGSAARQKAAQLVEADLTALLNSTRGLYLAALQADRVPLQGTSDLSTWWGVEVRSLSTTGSLMTFQIAKTEATSTITWTNVYGITSSSTTNQALAPEALANLLYYSKTVAGGPGSATATTTG